MAQTRTSIPGGQPPSVLRAGTLAGGTHLGDVGQFLNEFLEDCDGGHRAWGGETAKAGESNDQGQPERHGARSQQEEPGADTEAGLG